MADFVTYSAGALCVRAAVRRRFRDGSVSVEPFFFQDKDGRDAGPFIGGRVRLAAGEFSTVVN